MPTWNACWTNGRYELDLDNMTSLRATNRVKGYTRVQEDEEPLEPDELPEHLRPQPQIDFSKMDMSNPENLLKATKKGKTLMSFVAVTGSPTRAESEEITKLWQTSLWNNHIQAERYVLFHVLLRPIAHMFYSIHMQVHDRG